MRTHVLVLTALLACSDDPTDLVPGDSSGSDAGAGDIAQQTGFGLEPAAPEVEACGPVGAVGAECTFLDQCGVDPNRNPGQWDREPDQGRTGLCVAGDCFNFARLDQSGRALTGFMIISDQQRRYGRSLIGSVIAPVTADGRALDCADFFALNGCDPAADGVQVVNTTRFGFAGLAVGERIALTNNTPPGEWIFTVAVYSGGEGRGRIVDYGCQDGIELTDQGQVLVDGVVSETPGGQAGFQIDFTDRDFSGG